MQISIFLQQLWVLAFIFWNLSGLELVDSGELVPTPVPSWEAIIILFGIGILLLALHFLKFRPLYKLMSLAGAIYAGIAVYHAFFAGPEIWENLSSWQWGGAIINLIGLVANLTGVFGRSYSRVYNPDPVSPYFSNSSDSKE